jgi:mannose-P-dolichol utilization defect protein 1
MQTAATAFSKGLPFSVYGENIIILGQNFVILLLIWQFNKTIGCMEKLFFIAFFSAYTFILFSGEYMDDQLWNMVSSSSSIMNLAAKMPQLYANYCAKSTGQMAFFTFFLNFVGTIARLGTVLFESDDVYFQI